MGMDADGAGGHGKIPWRQPAVRVAMSIVLGAALAAGCDVNAALQRLADARGVAADLAVQFTQAADAANLAVLADTDEASVGYARDAEQAKTAVQKDIDTLDSMLKGLGFSDEDGLLQQFVARFADYRALDSRILDLAVQNTNLKAQQLSFGPAQQAADTFRDALDAVAAAAPAAESWHIRALCASAVASLRDIQALQAPHIAEGDDAAMARLEQRMTASEASARRSLDALAALVPATSRARLTAATTALDEFMRVNTQILSLSHRNTNVRSLALSLDEKRTVTAACEDRLHALQDALARRGHTSGR